MSSSYIALEKIPALRQSLRDTFRSGLTKTLEWRKNQLSQLARMLRDNHGQFAEALFADMGRGTVEAYAGEIQIALDRTLVCLNELPKWMETDWKTPSTAYKDESFAGLKPRVYREPKGTVLIISPWNYPLVLAIQPLIGAISAGCCALVKPSDISVHTSELLAELLPQYLDTRAYQVALGAVKETTVILEQRWDHICYTGNGRVARIISAAAAKHLTPLTLELGGKNPVLVDPAYPDLKLAARRIFWGRLVNAGQFCVAPDFVLISKDVSETFLKGLQEAHDQFYPPVEGGIEARYTDLAHIISKSHFDRLSALLQGTKGKVLFGGLAEVSSGSLKIPPTVVVLEGEGWADDTLMQTENFGPILVVVILPAKSSLDLVNQALDFVSDNENQPLTFYVFSERDSVKELARTRTLSGSIVFNDTMVHVTSASLPLNGVGESGHGYQTAKYGFEEFTYQRSCIDVPLVAEPALLPRYPPHTKEKSAYLANLCDTTPIPDIVK